ncbi:MAG: AraC family transcriptional regulator [Chloroflexi bacterium]|nr:AraC family transcriptional regulator [Chloroflexota bacterium]
MSIVFTARPSDSPFVESVTHGWTLAAGTPTRPAECSWHMVFVKVHGEQRAIITGPQSTSGIARYGEGAEIVWLKFGLGTFMPHLPTRDLLDSETLLPEGAGRSFWLKGSTWEFPSADNVETFVSQLVREEILVRDPLVDEVLKGHTLDVASRTIRHRFLRATGLSQNHIRQFERAREAAALLERGVSVLDTVYEAGYFDQPHLTRSMKRFLGYTPAEHVAETSRSA